jgi:hypothetical protein
MTAYHELLKKVLTGKKFFMPDTYGVTVDFHAGPTGEEWQLVDDKGRDWLEFAKISDANERITAASSNIVLRNVQLPA